VVIKKLSEKFRSYGVHYSQIERTGDIALFSLRHGEVSAIVGYDVVQVQSYTVEQANRALWRNMNAIPGNPDDVVESYPSSRQWGQQAWSFDSLPAAREKYWQLVNQEKRKTIEQVSGWRTRKEPAYRI